jgi:site-specific DNA-adenine methylase
VTFPYFGTKNALAKHYPAPIPGAPIIEPFAGAAGSACHWARQTNGQVMAYLYDKDPRVVEVWKWLQNDPASFIREGDAAFHGETACVWPFNNLAGGSHDAPTQNADRPWLRNEWRKTRRYVALHSVVAC